MFPKMHLFSLIGDDCEIQYSEEQRCITLHNKIFAQVGQNLKQLNGEIRKGANTLRKVLFFFLPKTLCYFSLEFLGA